MKFHVLHSMWVLALFFEMSSASFGIDFSRTKGNTTTWSMSKGNKTLLALKKDNTTANTTTKGNKTVTLTTKNGNSTTFNLTKLITAPLNTTKGNTSTTLNLTKIIKTALNFTKGNSSWTNWFNSSTNETEPKHLSKRAPIEDSVRYRSCAYIRVVYKYTNSYEKCTTEFCYNITSKLPLKHAELRGLYLQNRGFNATIGNWTADEALGTATLNLAGVKFTPSDHFCFKVKGFIFPSTVNVVSTKHDGHTCNYPASGPGVKQGVCLTPSIPIPKRPVAAKEPTQKNGQMMQDDDLFTKAEEVYEKARVYARTVDVSSSDDEGLGGVNGASSTGGPIVQGRADGMTSVTPNIGVPPGTGWTQSC